MDGLFGLDGGSAVAKRSTCIRVAVIAVEIAAGDFDTQSVALGDKVTGRPKIDAKGINPARLYGPGSLIRIPKARSQDAVLDFVDPAIGKDIAENHREVSIGGAGGSVEYGGYRAG